MSQGSIDLPLARENEQRRRERLTDCHAGGDDQSHRPKNHHMGQGTQLNPAAMFRAFVAASDDFYGSLDIAALNLCCALGLPGAENLDIDILRAKVDDMARHVLLETERHYYRFLDNPADYQDSQGYFCILMLITVLQQDCEVQYNPKRVRDPKFQDPDCFDPDFSDSKDLFIHGILDGPGGTCCSMPVLLAAVCRRLAYPVKLVEAPGHLFARWDDRHGKFNGGPDRFNIDCSGRGFASHSDEYYKRWPRPWTKHEEESGCYLKSLTPRQEIAAFMATRGHCLWDNGRLGDAIRAYCMATIFAPHDPRYDWQLCDAYKEYRVEMVKKTEAAKVRLTIEEQLELQSAIARGHVARLRDGILGLPRSDFGVKKTVVDAARHVALPCTGNMNKATVRAEVTAVRGACEQTKTPRLLNQSSQHNHQPFFPGLPSMNERDFGV